MRMTFSAVLLFCTGGGGGVNVGNVCPGAFTD